MMEKMKLFLVAGLVLCVAGAANAALVNQAADLDLTNVVKAINFGDTSTQTVNGIDFLQAWAGTTVDGVSNEAGANIGNWAGGPTLSGTDAAALWEIYATNVYNANTVNISTALADGYYKVQVLLYEQWTGSRTVTLTAESTVADPLIMGTSTHPSGLVVDCNTFVTDGTLDIVVYGDAANMHVAGLIINTATPPSDQTPPAAPTNLAATSNEGSISLEWDDNVESDLDSYIVYRSTTSGSGYAMIATGVTDPNYVDTPPVLNTPQYYVVAAKDTAGNVSANSNEASGTVFGQGTLLDEPADLDLTNVLRAINFGVTTDQTISGVLFSAADAGATVDGVTNTASGSIYTGQYDMTVADIGDTADDDALEEILSASIYGSVDIDVPVPPGNYQVQTLYFEAWPASATPGARTCNLTIEGTLVAADYDQYAEQGASSNAGSVVTYTLDVLDGNLDITNDNIHVSGLIVNVNEFYEPGVINNPDPLTVEAGAPASFTVNAANVVSYTWKKDGVAVVDGGTISGQGTATLEIYPVVLGDEGDYSCDISGDGSIESAPAQLLTKRLIGHWPLDTNLNDTNTEGPAGVGPWNGTRDPEPDFVTGQIDGALAMGPIAEPNDLITVAGSEDYFNFYPRGITVSLWVNQSADAINQNLAYKGDLAIWNEAWIIWSNYNTGAAWNLEQAGTVLYGVFDRDTWHNVVGTYDPAEGTQRLYIDGIAVDEVTGMAPITLAGNTGLLNFGFTGIIDDVKIYSFARDAADIAQDYANEGNSTVCFERPTLDVAPVGALDCIVSLPDLAEFAMQWLLDGNKYDQTP